MDTPLHWAALNRHLACVKLLVSRGCGCGDTNEVGHDALFEAELGEKDGSEGGVDGC